MKPQFGIIEERLSEGYKVITVDTGKATYQGITWKNLGDFGKRKWENYLFLSNPKERIKVIYV